MGLILDCMRADRLVSLVLLLQARGRTTAAALAAELEVSIRTVYRDMEALSLFGVPVYAEAGPGGGCQLLEGYRFPLGPLRAEEAAALLVLGVPEVFAELGLSEWLVPAHHRLLATSGLAGSRRPPLVHLDMPRWFHSPEPVPWLAALAEALRSGRRVVIDYQRGGGEGSRRRSVGPLGLVNKAGLWYLIASALDGPTSVFRVGRIHAAELLDERFGRPADFDLVVFWKAWSEQFAASRPRLAVVLRASPTALGIFPEVLGDAAREAVARAEPADEEGWRLLTLTFESMEAAAHRLLGFGDTIEVVSPPHVRRHLLGTAEAVVRRYRPSANP